MSWRTAEVSAGKATVPFLLEISGADMPQFGDRAHDWSWGSGSAPRLVDVSSYLKSFCLSGSASFSEQKRQGYLAVRAAYGFQPPV